MVAWSRDEIGDVVRIMWSGGKVYEEDGRGEEDDAAEEEICR